MHEVFFYFISILYRIMNSVCVARNDRCKLHKMWLFQALSIHIEQTLVGGLLCQAVAL